MMCLKNMVASSTLENVLLQLKRGLCETVREDMGGWSYI